MNVLTISGNLTRDPEIQTTKSGIKIAHGTIAVSRARKDQEGNRLTDFIDFTAFDKKAELLKEYAHKGDRVEASGRLESRKYTDRNDQERTAWELIIEQVNILSKKEDKPEQKEEKPEPPPEPKPSYLEVDDDLPF